MNPVASVVSAVGGWRRRQSPRSLVLLAVLATVVAVAVVAGLALGLRGPSRRPTAGPPVPATSSPTPVASPTPIEFQVLTPLPTDTPSPSATPTSASSTTLAGPASPTATLTISTEPENGLKYLSVTPSTLHEKARVSSGSLSITAKFSDLITEGDADAYWFSTDWGDGSPAQGGSSSAISIQDDTITVTFRGAHTWAQPGTYAMTIRLADSDAGTAVATVTVTVRA